uniref:Uncharacterized protein n=1 Tax=Panagrolaimus superbus TaxID=310955 RepID=A0A914YU83_9BILA
MDDDFNYGDDAFMYSQGMEFSFLNEPEPEPQPLSPIKKSPRKNQRFGTSSEMHKSFCSPQKKDISIIDLSESPLFARRPLSNTGSPIPSKRPPSISGSPVFAKRPPSINLDDPTTFSKPKELKFNIPENVPFSELDDEVSELISFNRNKTT